MDLVIRNFEAVQKITNEVFEADHPSDLHIIGVTYDPANRSIRTPEGYYGHVGQWIVRYEDGTLGVTDYETMLEVEAAERAEYEISNCEYDRNWDPVRHAYPAMAAAEARRWIEIEKLRAENTVMTAKLKAVTDYCNQHQAVATNWDVEQLATVGGYNTALVRILDLLATFDASDPEATDA